MFLFSDRETELMVKSKTSFLIYCFPAALDVECGAKILEFFSYAIFVNLFPRSPIYESTLQALLLLISCFLAIPKIYIKRDADDWLTIVIIYIVLIIYFLFIK